MTQPLIRLQGLSRHYHMGQHVVKALDEVDLEINAGEFVAIVVHGGQRGKAGERLG